MRFALLAALGGVFLLHLAVGCDQTRARLVGKWKVESDPSAMVWEFMPNGAVKVGETAGKYTFGDRGRIKIQTPTATYVYEVQVGPETMTWKEPNGSRTELRRVP